MQFIFIAVRQYFLKIILQKTLENRADFAIFVQGCRITGHLFPNSGLQIPWKLHKLTKKETALLNLCYQTVDFDCSRTFIHVFSPEETWNMRQVCWLWNIIYDIIGRMIPHKGLQSA